MEPKNAIIILFIIFIIASLVVGFLYVKFRIISEPKEVENILIEKDVPLSKSQAADQAKEVLKNNPNNTKTNNEKSQVADQAIDLLRLKKVKNN